MRKLTYILIMIIISIAFFIPCQEIKPLKCNNIKNESIELPIIMYHSVMKTHTNKFSISPTKFEEDIIWLVKNGYHSVTPHEISNYVKNNGILPERPIMITFDDGHFNVMHYALPILKKYNFKANINIIGKDTEIFSNNGDESNPNYSYLTWSQINELSESGVFEIGNHTWNMHKTYPRKGIKQLSSENQETYIKNLTDDLTKVQEYLKNKSNVSCKTFAYPFGYITKESIKILKNLNIDVVLWASEGKNILIKGNEDCLNTLKRYNRDSSLSTKQFMKKLLYNG